MEIKCGVGGDHEQQTVNCSTEEKLKESWAEEFSFEWEFKGDLVYSLYLGLSRSRLTVSDVF